ncbi:hypothetical protein [Bordetella trematum]|uniref:hypothetical protein n=1 Tax=Bordetella trematum TaxID=123899 RepID=UPI001269E5D8|nr:hypothetical protein [Bordetella trematum]QIM72590.1 hypothetical protein EYB34_15210 [Bordetella trematum]
MRQLPSPRVKSGLKGPAITRFAVLPRFYLEGFCILGRAIGAVYTTRLLLKTGDNTKAVPQKTHQAGTGKVVACLTKITIGAS